MIGKSSPPILKQTLAPVMLVISFWVIMSLMTTYFIFWVEHSSQRVFEQNVITTNAARRLQIVIWKLVAEFPDEMKRLAEFRSDWNAAKSTMDFELQEIQRSAFMDEEFAELRSLAGYVAELNQFMDRLPWISAEGDIEEIERENAARARSRVTEFAKRIVGSAQVFFDLNQSVVDQYRLSRKLLSKRVNSARWAMLTLGPVLGLVLGWRVGKRLHRSIARIAVTLHGADSSNELGIVDIDSSGDFHHVERQAEHVAERIRTVSRELHVARSQVLQSERLAAVGGLAAGVAHEIRNPLTSVKLLLQHAVRQGAEPSLDESKLRLILSEVNRMETTIQGLLDFSRPPKLNRVPHDFRQTLQRALNLVEARSRQQHIEIETHFDDAPLMVDGDTEKLHQLLVNLLLNAVEAMPLGGRLSVEATSVIAQGRMISLRRNGAGDLSRNVVQIVIRDTGEGISEDVMPRLFEPFASTKERGTGLGLAVSHRIAEEHGGTIYASNDPHGGARFTVSIPRIDVSTAEAPLKFADIPHPSPVAAKTRGPEWNRS